MADEEKMTAPIEGGQWFTSVGRVVRAIKTRVDELGDLVAQQGATLTGMGTTLGGAASGTAVGALADRVSAVEQILAGRAMRRTQVKTLVAIGIGGGSTDITVTWPTAMPAAAYTITVAGGLPAGVSAAPTGVQTAAGCTVRVTSTGVLAIGQVIDVTAWS